MSLKHPIGTRLKHTAYNNDIVTVEAHLPPSKSPKPGTVARERYLINRGDRKTRISEETAEKEYEVVA